MKRFSHRDFTRLNISMKVQLIILILTVTVTVFFGCSSTKTVQKPPEMLELPPKVDLKSYNYVGVIQFSSNAEDNVNEYVTQNFIQTIQSAQAGVRVLELGREEELLKSIKCNRIDFEAIKAIGKKFNVDAIVFGHVEVSEIKPKIRISSMLNSVHAEGHIEVKLNTRLWEAQSGATLWTNSSFGKDSVANFNLIKKGAIRFGASDPKEKYGKLVPELVYANTMDFRPQYVYK